MMVLGGRKETTVTRYTTNRPETEVAREARTPVRLPEQMTAGLFQGWGPKV
jgi:hypothetical protein